MYPNTLSHNSQSMVSLANSMLVVSGITLRSFRSIGKITNGDDMINADFTDSEQLLELQF